MITWGFDFPLTVTIVFLSLPFSYHFFFIFFTLLCSAHFYAQLIFIVLIAQSSNIFFTFSAHDCQFRYKILLNNCLASYFYFYFFFVFIKCFGFTFLMTFLFNFVVFFFISLSLCFIKNFLLIRLASLLNFFSLQFYYNLF